MPTKTWTPPSYASSVSDESSSDSSSPDTTNWTPPDYATPHNENENKSLLSKGLDYASSFLDNHPTIKKYGQRLLTGTDPESDEMFHKAGVTSINAGDTTRKFNPDGTTTEHTTSILPEWKSQPETYGGGFLKSIYNDFVRPLGEPSQIIAGSHPVTGGRIWDAGIKQGEVVPEPRELLTRGEGDVRSGFNDTRPGAAPIEGEIIHPNNEAPPIRQTPETGLQRLLPEQALPVEHTIPERQSLITQPTQPIPEATLEQPVSAKFRGFMETGDESDPHMALYDVTGGPYNGSTVSRGRLESLGLDIPQTPNPPSTSGGFDLSKRQSDNEPSFSRDTSNNPLAQQEEKPLFARSEQGGIKTGVNIKRTANELTTGYSQPLEKIMVREALQNSIDAVRHLDKDGKLDFKMLDDGFELTDNGKGMNRHQLETVFSDLYESGKTSEAGATGGKGIGKATFQRGGQLFSTETVVFEKGKKVKYSFSGTSKQFDVHVPINEEVVPLSTPTGTKIQVKFKEGQERYRANNMFNDIMNHSRDINTNITRNQYGITEAKTFKSSKDDTTIYNSKEYNSPIHNSDVRIAIPKDEKLEDRSYIEVQVLNNGMYQYSENIYTGEKAPNMPENLIVDIHPHAEEGTVDYPFPTQRESLKKEMDTEVKDIIKRVLIEPQQKARKNRTQELYDSMTEFSGPNSKRKLVLFDPGQRLDANELEDFQTSPIIHELMSHFDNSIDAILKSINIPEWSGRLEGVGLFLGQPRFCGVHIPNPTTGKSTILINPFAHALKDTNTSDIGMDSSITALHEVAHIGKGSVSPSDVKVLTPKELADPRLGKYLQSYLSHVVEQGSSTDYGHGVDFIKRLAKVFSDFGPERTFNAADRIEKIIGDGSGKLNSEFARILQIYTDSRGRPETTEDLLSPTGIKHADAKGGKGNIPSSDGSTRERASRKDVTKRAVSALMNALEGAKSVLGEQANINRATRARRFAAFKGVKGEGTEWFSKAMGKLKGEYDKVELPEEIQLTKPQLNALFNAVKDANITVPEQARAGVALFKIVNGELPQRNELKLLDDVFGDGFAQGIVEMHGGIGMIGMKLGKVANTMKAVMSSTDASAPLRQGIGLIHRPEWRSAFVDMFKYMAKPAYFDAAMQALQEEPTYLLGRDAGLFTSKTGSLLSSEEVFSNNYISDLPSGAKGLFIKDIEGASERGYVGFLNKLRSDTFKNMVAKATELGHHMFTVVKHTAEDGSETSQVIPTKEAKAIAKYINYATGRGGLGRLERIAPELNILFFSPKMVTSRIGMLTRPDLYLNMPKGMRFEAIKSLFAIAGFGAAITTLGGLAGGKVIGNPIFDKANWFRRDKGDQPEITSSDFGKVRFGTQVLDPYGGFQQPIVAAARVVRDLSNNQPSKAVDDIKAYGINKLSPIGGLAYDISTAQKFTGGGGYQNRFGEQKSIQSETAKRFCPMFVQDFTDLLSSDANFAETVGLGAATALGAGLQDYPERTANKNKMKINKPKTKLSF